MIDLPQVSKIQNKNINKENLQERLVSVECDYNIDFPNELYDDVFYLQWYIKSQRKM